MDHETQGLGCDILSTDDLFRRSDGKECLNVKNGVYTENFTLPLYIDYSYCKMKPADYRINIGGFEAGIGIGYEF